MSDKTGIYVHVPFCLQKCRYCDFFSITDLSWKPAFLNALDREIRIRRDTAVQVDTVYFGGGTPSLLSVSEIASILAGLNLAFRFEKDMEITLEVNPGTLSPGYFEELRAAGINRVNIGVQSFDDQKLKFLGRIHSAAVASQAVSCALKTGIDRVGLDLIYGLPGETPVQWMHDLDRAVSIGSDHLSCYMLTCEPGTSLYDAVETGSVLLQDDGTVSELFLETSRHLSTLGWDHYEVSNFARDNSRQSRHNRKYWRGNPYLGFGPGAHSFQNVTRSWNHAGLDAYVKDLDHGQLPLAGSEVLTPADRLTELVMLGLRTREGIDIALFESVSGRSFEADFAPVIDLLQQRGWGQLSSGRLSLSTPGMVFLDSIVSRMAGMISL